jgi:hypothetical protein
MFGPGHQSSGIHDAAFDLSAMSVTCARSMTTAKQLMPTGISLNPLPRTMGFDPLR